MRIQPVIRRPRRPSRMAALGARTLAVMALAVFAAAPTAPAMAQSRIVLVVNGEPITSFEVAQRARLLRISPPPTIRRRKLSGNRLIRALTHYAREELVNDILKMEEAKKRSVTVSDAEVDAQFAGIAQNVRMSPANLGRRLQAMGIKPQTLKDRLRVQLAWQKTLRKRFRSSVRISEQEVIAGLRKKDALVAQSKTIEYVLGKLIVVVPGNATKKEVSEKARVVKDIRARFTNCADGMVLAKQMPDVVVTQARQTQTHGKLPEQAQKFIEETAVGHLTKPYRTKNGFEMIAVCEKNEIASREDARDKMELELRNEEGKILSRQYLVELRRNAVIERR